MRRRDTSSGRKGKSQESDGGSDNDADTTIKKAKCGQALSYERLSEHIRNIISEAVWSAYSPVRRKSFCLMHMNPNAFFYRSHPPGDRQRFGGFAQDEEKLHYHILSSMNLHIQKYGEFKDPSDQFRNIH
jgi:hypothetical protein